MFLFLFFSFLLYYLFPLINTLKIKQNWVFNSKTYSVNTHFPHLLIESLYTVSISTSEYAEEGHLVWKTIPVLQLKSVDNPDVWNTPAWATSAS